MERQRGGQVTTRPPLLAQQPPAPCARAKPDPVRHAKPSLVHLAEVFRLADAAGLLADPDRAAARMRVLTALHGL